MSLAPRLAGKRALVTGAAGGIGRAIVARFVEHGAQVAIADLRFEAARAISDALNQAYGRALTLPVALDVTSEQGWDTALAQAAQAMGGLSILVHNAGVLVRGALQHLSYEDWQRAHRVNVDAVFLGSQKALPLLQQSQPASIVVISSISAAIASHDMPAYNSSKAACAMLAKSIALHCAKQRLDIRCNSVLPTFIDTPMLDDFRGQIGHAEADAKLARQVPLRRLGTPDDVANAAIHLGSDESRFITAAELRIDGGISAM